MSTFTPTEIELARQLRETQINAHRTIAILLAKLGGSAQITDDELTEWAATTIRQARDERGMGFRLTVEQVSS